MDAKPRLKPIVIAFAALPLLAACHGSNTVPSETDALIREFITRYDHALNAHQFDHVVPMYTGGATITIKNPFIHTLTGGGPSEPADKAAYERIAKGDTMTPMMAFGSLSTVKDLRYTLERQSVAVAHGAQPGQYVVQSAIKEVICGTPRCTTTLTDDRMTVVVSDGTVHIQSDEQTVTAVHPDAGTAPTP